MSTTGSGVRELERLGVRVRRVERPGSEKEAQAVLAAASRDGLTVLPCGGGTALGAGILPDAVDVVLDTTGLDRVLAFDPKNLHLAVLAGVTLGDLDRRLAAEGKGFFLPLDPPWSDRATVGGVYASNGSGPLRLRYGTVRDLALGVRAANARGAEVGFGGKTVKNVSGLDLTRLLVGSAGSLALVTSLSLRVVPLPEAGALCRLRFPGLGPAEAFLSRLRASVLLPSAVILTARGAGVADGCAVVAAVEGHPAAVDRQVRDVLAIAREAGGEGEDEPGRAAVEYGLKAAVEPALEWGECPITLKVSVPPAWGPRTWGALIALAASLGVRCQVALLAGTGIAYFHAWVAEDEGARSLAAGVRETAVGETGHATPVRASLAVLRHWGPRTDPAVARLVLRPVKEHLDPGGVLPSAA